MRAIAIILKATLFGLMAGGVAVGFGFVVAGSPQQMARTVIAGSLIGAAVGWAITTASETRMTPLLTDRAEPALLQATTTNETHAGHSASLAALVLTGVVFGDIGTSPLYTLRECLTAAGGAEASRADLFGILSLMFWALVMVVTVKYLCFIMRASHHGEGGIFALLAIVPDRFRTHATGRGKITGMALLAVIGASLLYGDGVITPAISVLSAVEGLTIASPRLEPLVVPLTCGILVALFAIQRRGTGSIGRLFGPTKKNDRRER